MGKIEMSLFIAISVFKLYKLLNSNIFTCHPSSGVACMLRECLNYNTFDGKKSRGKMVISALHFLKGGKPSEDDVQKAIYLGELRFLFCSRISGFNFPKSLKTQIRIKKE